MALVLCNGMNRSGSTLQYNMARMLVERTAVGIGDSFLQQDEMDGHLEQLEAWAVEERLHVLKTHDLPPSARHLWENGSLRMLYIYRDIRDVAASMKRIWNYEGETLLTALDQAIETYYEMRDMPHGVLLQKYENVMEDREKAVRDIADFLQIPLSAQLGAGISTDCSVEKMLEVQNAHQKNVRAEKARIRKLSFFRRALRKLGIQINGPARRSRQFEPVTALHGNHIGENKGAAGTWSTILSDHEANTITERYRTWLEEENYLAGKSEHQ